MPIPFCTPFWLSAARAFIHVTFNIPGSKSETERLRELGVPIAEEVEDDARHEAYISPRSSHMPY